MVTLFEVLSVAGIVWCGVVVAFIIAATERDAPGPLCVMGEDICPIHGGSRA